MFQYEKGIPDNQWCKPNDSGILEYMPDFSYSDYFAHAQFRFYAEAFFQKVFSSFDTIYHILNIFFSLGVEERQVGNKPFFNRLEKEQPKLHEALKRFSEDDRYKSAKKIRDDLIHNEPPQGISKTVRKEKNKLYFGCKGEYKTCEQIVGIVKDTLDLFCELLNAIKGFTGNTEDGT